MAEVETKAPQAGGGSGPRRGPGGGAGRGRGPGGPGRGPGGPGRGRGPGGPRQKPEANESGLDEIVVRISRCATVVKGGRRFSFGALVVVGDRRGNVGIGYGKAKEVPSAVEKGKKIASRSLVKVKLVAGTLPHRVIGRFGASHVVMVPASAGTGVIAGPSVRAVLELVGVHDVLTKSYGSNTPKNLVRATLSGLTSMVTREEVESLRGLSLAS